MSAIANGSANNAMAKGTTTTATPVQVYVRLLDGRRQVSLRVNANTPMSLLELKEMVAEKAEMPVDSLDSWYLATVGGQLLPSTASFDLSHYTTPGYPLTLQMRGRLRGGGKLYFYYSAMNAGKTTTLLQSSFNYNERGMHTLLFTPLVDNRYQVGKITSRLGLNADAQVFDADFDFYAFCQDAMHRCQYSCILVDEAQFLNKEQVRQLCQVVDELNVPVLAYGLRSDFLGEPFEGSKYLLAWADELTEIKTICFCGRKATMNARVDAHGKMVEVGDQIEIGDNSRYVSVCRRHFQRKHTQMGDVVQAAAAVAAAASKENTHATLDSSSRCDSAVDMSSETVD